MKSAKILVTVMTTLIAVCIVFLAYGLATRTTSFQETATQTKNITLPSISTIQLMTPYKNGVALYVATPQGDFIYFADPKNGLDPVRLSIKRQD